MIEHVALLLGIVSSSMLVVGLFLRFMGVQLRAIGKPTVYCERCVWSRQIIQSYMCGNVDLVGTDYVTGEAKLRSCQFVRGDCQWCKGYKRREDES